MSRKLSGCSAEGNTTSVCRKKCDGNGNSEKEERKAYLREDGWTVWRGCRGRKCTTDSHKLDSAFEGDFMRRVNMQPAEQTRTRTISGGGHTSKGWHQGLPRAKHSWYSQKDDDRWEGHKIAGRLMYRDGTRRWESRWQTWTTGSRRYVRLSIHSTPIAEEFD